MINEELVALAKCIAIDAHANQVDKAGAPIGTIPNSLPNT